MFKLCHWEILIFHILHVQHTLIYLLIFALKITDFFFINSRHLSFLLIVDKMSIPLGLHFNLFWATYRLMSFLTMN